MKAAPVGWRVPGRAIGDARTTSLLRMHGGFVRWKERRALHCHGERPVQEGFFEQTKPIQPLFSSSVGKRKTIPRGPRGMAVSREANRLAPPFTRVASGCLLAGGWRW